MPTPIRPDYPVINDPARPQWHFGPPAQWMNDPNGIIWHEGWCHLFYQHNPGGDEWGDMHWGHARSRDLINWEHLPIALHPQHAAGEHHCYSGCCVPDAVGAPRILYTSVPPEAPRRATQIMATPNGQDLVNWTQRVTSPVLDLATHGGPDFPGDWRDPYVFQAEGRTFLILGAVLGNESVLPLYENPDGNLHQWVYRGILWRELHTDTRFLECPSLVPIGDHWVLFTAPCRQMEWHRGTLDLQTYRFHAEQNGRLDESVQCYASQVKLAPDGRAIAFSWARHFPKNRGWNGCLAVPRHVWLEADGLCSAPIAEIDRLHEYHVAYPAAEISAEPLILSLPGDCSSHGELQLHQPAGARLEIELCGVKVLIEHHRVSFADQPSAPLHDDQHLRLVWLLDRSLLELFINDRATCTRVVAYPSLNAVKLRATPGAKLIAGRAWSMRAAPVMPRAT